MGFSPRGRAQSAAKRFHALRFGRHFRHGALRPAFTIVELLVVVVIIIVLIGAMLGIGSVVITNARVKNTEALLLTVQTAIDDFKQNESANPTITRARQPKAGVTSGDEDQFVRYEKRYGLYPPDELEPFTKAGLPGSAPPPADRSLLPPSNDPAHRQSVVPRPPYKPMRFYRDGSDDDKYEHRDIAALFVALRLVGGSPWEILEHVPERNWSRGLTYVASGDPAQFINRVKPDIDDYDPPGVGAADYDEPIRYLLDAWGVPLGYMAQRDFKTPGIGVKNVPSSNHVEWNEVSTQLVRLNDGKPLLFSYGPDGAEQLSKDWMEEQSGGDPGASTLIEDWIHDEPGMNRIDHPLNEDNVYADPGLKEKLFRGLSGV